MKLPCRGVLGNQDQVPTSGDPPVQAHPLSQHALDPISNDRVPYLLGDREPEPTLEGRVGPLPKDRKHVATVHLPTVRLDGDIVGTLSQPHLLGNAQGSAAGHATSWRWSPRYAYGPSRDDGAGPHGHHGSSCGRGSRACACGSCCAVDTYASRFSPSPGLWGAGSILKRAPEVKADASASHIERAERARDRRFAHRHFPSTNRGKCGVRDTHGWASVRSSLGSDFGLPGETLSCYQRRVPRLWISHSGCRG